MTREAHRKVIRVLRWQFVAITGNYKPPEVFQSLEDERSRRRRWRGVGLGGVVGVRGIFVDLADAHPEFNSWATRGSGTIT